MTSKEWEKHTLDGDRKIKKRIEKYRKRSTARVILGIFVAFFKREESPAFLGAVSVIYSNVIVDSIFSISKIQA